MIALIPKELFFSACVPQAESLIYWCAETSGSVNPRSWERKRKVAIQSAKEHRDVSQSCLLHIQSQPVVHWHYSHKTPLCRAAVWAGIAIAWWKLECFFNIDFCWDGWEENHVEVIIKIETQRDSCKLHTLTAAFVGGCQAGITQHSLTCVLSAHFLCWSQSWI